MGALPALRFALIALVCAVPRLALAAGGDDPPDVIRVDAVDTQSGVAITGFRVDWLRPNPQLHEPKNARVACVAFENRNRSEAKRIGFSIAYYDALNNHAGDATLVRHGSFASGKTIEASDPRTGIINRDDCVFLPYHEQGIARIVVFVNSVTFADGSSWTTPGPEVSTHIAPE